jgi:NhaA family Na+:H+ antiporter
MNRNRNPAAGILLRQFNTFFELESASGILLLVAAAVALAWANSPWAESYVHLWQTPVTFGFGALAMVMTLHDWVNDALMAVFFFVVGLEIKRELLVGELATPRKAALSLVAAFGGMLMPATIYALVNRGGEGARGWGIPMATDIAFALGVLALLGKRVPAGLKTFLAAVAIADDLGAVIVIALFYTTTLAWGALGAASAVFALLMFMNRSGVRRSLPYAVVGIVLWLAVLKSGVHATIAGVLLAIAIPALSQQADSTLTRIEHALHPFVGFVIMPIFALANAGVSVGGVPTVLGPITVGVVLGLVLGKQIGVMLAAWLFVRTGLAVLPESVSWRHMWGVAILCGIGFTMSLFIAGLAFEQPRTLDAAKIGVLIGSLASGVLGSLVLLRVSLSTSAGDTQV